MNSTHNKGKSIIAERFIRILKNKICKYMTSVSTNVYMDKLDDILNKYNDTFHRTIKMKPLDVKSNTYIASSKKINDKNPTLEIGNNVRILKYRNLFATDYGQNWCGEVFVIKKVKDAVPSAYVINYLNGEGIVGKLYQNEL